MGPISHTRDQTRAQALSLSHWTIWEVLELKIKKKKKNPFRASNTYADTGGSHSFPLYPSLPSKYNFPREFSTCSINIRKFSAFPVNIPHSHQPLTSLHCQLYPHDFRELALTKVTSHPFVHRSRYFVEVFTYYYFKIIYFYWRIDNCFTEFCCFLSNLNMNQP